jgi:hypothetical protein
VPARVWFVGCNGAVHGIEWRRGELAFTLDISPSIQQLFVVAADEVLVVHEIGALRLQPDGTVAWRYTQDLVVGHRYWDGRLELDFMGSDDVTLDVATGAEVRV